MSGSWRGSVREISSLLAQRKDSDVLVCVIETLVVRTRLSSRSLVSMGGGLRMVCGPQSPMGLCVRLERGNWLWLETTVLSAGSDARTSGRGGPGTVAACRGDG